MAKKCGCGCGRDASAGRDYAWGHKPKNVAVQAAPKTPSHGSSNGHGKFAAVIAQLTAERDKLNDAIAVLEKLS